MGKCSDNFRLGVVDERFRERDPSTRGSAHKFGHQTHQFRMAGSRCPSTHQHPGHCREIEYPNTAFVDLYVTRTNSSRNGTADRKEQERTATLGKLLMLQQRSTPQSRSDHDRDDLCAVLTLKRVKLPKNTPTLPRLMADGHCYD